MVQASIDNTPVSISLSGDESTTVPTGETWKVTLTCGSNTELHINGGRITGSNAGNGEPNVDEFETVLTGGDSITNGLTGTVMCHIGGFKV